MIKNKYKKIIIISFAIVFSIISVMTIITSENILHTEHCDISSCTICKLINISEGFIKNIGLININIFMVTIFVPLIQLINKNIQKERKQTLVEAKVIQNK